MKTGSSNLITFCRIAFAAWAMLAATMEWNRDSTINRVPRMLGLTNTKSDYYNSHAKLQEVAKNLDQGGNWLY